jgi:hypothetical protein
MALVPSLQPQSPFAAAFAAMAQTLSGHEKNTLPQIILSWDNAMTPSDVQPWDILIRIVYITTPPQEETE